MKQNKNSVTLILMCSSIFLLLVLQFLWLRSSYTKAFDELKKETNGIFRTTVFSMRDTLIQRAFESMPADSALRMMRSKKKTFWSAFEDDPDSSSRQAKFETRRPGMREFAHRGPERDSLSRKRERSESHAGEFRDRRDFIFRLGPDSLKVDSITLYFGRALVNAGIELPFRVVHVRRTDKRVLPKGFFISEAVRLNPVRRYAVIFSGFKKELIRGIMPQALFSIFLTLLTTLSFYILYRSIIAQQRLVQLKNDFISNITHELKTPITTVSVALEALKNFQGLNNPKLTEEYLGIAQNELGRLTILTDKILKTAVYEDKGVSFQMERVDIEKLINQVLGSLKLVLEKNSASVSFEKEGTDFSIQGDPDHLINVIYNLVDNALKYSPSPAIVKIKLKEKTSEIMFSIGDNGPGIPTEYRKKIFEKFFRVPTGDIHNVKGYGLGLSYVDSVVKGHKGTIEVKSEFNNGALFIINLPKLLV